MRNNVVTLKFLNDLAKEKIPNAFTSVEKCLEINIKDPLAKFALYINFKDIDNKAKALSNATEYLFYTKQDVYEYLLNFKGDIK